MNEPPFHWLLLPPEYKVKIYFLHWICATGTVGSDLPHFSAMYVGLAGAVACERRPSRPLNT